MTDERDAHLREALRHAPDAQVEPPAALSDFILKEARAKVRHAVPSPADARSPLTALWVWLARPSAAAGFAGLMAATLVGVMWWDQPMDDALPRSPVPAAMAPAPAPQQAPASTAEAVTAPADEPERRPPQATPRRAVEADKADSRQRKKEAPVPAATTPAAPPEQRADAAPPAREEQAVVLSSSAPVPAAMPPPVPGGPSADSTDNSTNAAAGAAGSLAKSRAADERTRGRAAAPAAATTRGRSVVPADLDELRQSRAKMTPTLGALRSAIASEPARWAWQREDVAPQRIDDAVHSWLARLDADAGGRWQPVDAAVMTLAGEIRLLHDGQLKHGFQLTEGGVLWRRPQGGWQRVRLPPASLRVLETSAP